MPGRGFSLTVVPRNGRAARHYEIGGKRLFLLWTAGAAAVALVAAAMFVLIAGFPFGSSSSQREMRISELEDSLRVALDIQSRLDSVEAGLEELRQARERLENIAEFAGPLPGDTL